MASAEHEPITGVWGQSPPGADASDYSMPYLPYFFSICTCVLLVISYCAQMLSFWSYTTVPVAFHLPLLCIFTKFEVQERNLPITSGAVTPFPCVARHYND